MPYIEFGNPNMARTQNKMPYVPSNTNKKLANWYTMKSLFSNNAQVIQKPRVNYGGSVGTVSNSRLKSRYT
uniref:Uncharacterized protein n=1 Tax=viral metagenome TaxID=1070528 RepID=A0A6C0B3T8_9ZZZZ